MQQKNQPAASSCMRGAFQRELNRLIATSDLGLEAIAEIVGLPIAALAGAHGGAIRVPVTKLAAIAELTNADQLELTRTWCAEYAPWVLELLEDLCLEVRARSDRGIST